MYSDVGNYSFFKPSMVNASTPKETSGKFEFIRYFNVIFLFVLYQDNNDFNLNIAVPQQQSDESELLFNRNSSFANLLREIESLQGSNLNCESTYIFSFLLIFQYIFYMI